MLTFPVGTGRVHALAYTPDSLSLVVDLRGEPQRHPCMGFTVRPATELVWWEIATGTTTRRFRLRDSLYGPGGCQTDPDRVGDDARPDWNPALPALDLSFCVSPLRAATVWEWTNKEDGVCAFDLEGLRTIDLRTPYKTHTRKLALSPDGSKLLAATVNNMDPYSKFEVWDVSSRPETPPDELQSRPRDLHWWERNSAVLNGCDNPLGSLAGLAFDGRFVAALDGEHFALLVWDSCVAQPPKVPRLDADGHVDWDVSPHEGTFLEFPFAPQCVAFAPGGARLAVGGAGLALVNPLTLECTEFPRSGNGIASAVAFGSDGRELLAGTDAGTVEVWDTASGQLIRAFDWGQGPVSAVAVAPDGATFAAGTETGQVVVWDRGD